MSPCRSLTAGTSRIVAILLVLTAAVSAPVLAQEPAPTPALSPGAPVRLLKNFVLDGAIQPNVWLEGQWRMENHAPLFDGEDGTRNFLSGILALGFNRRAEAGLSWGGINVEPESEASHSGVSDLEVYGKYLLSEAPVNLCVGGLVKIPVADSGELLGSGSVDWEGFAALRKDFGAVQAVANVGLRQNGDPDVPGVNGEASVLAGGGVIFELGKRSFGSLELSYESRRYEGLHSDFRMTPGMVVRLGERGFFRAGLGVGLSDGAPDLEGIAGFGWGY